MDFVVRTDVAWHQERLVKTGPDDEAGTFTRRLDRAAGIEAIFEHFSRPIETMVRHSARLDPIDWQQGLELLAGRAEHSPLRCWPYGSGALAVRGIPIEPGGLDPPHEDEDATEAHLELVSWHGLPIAVPHLGLQLAVAERRGLSERAARIREAMRP